MRKQSLKTISADSKKYIVPCYKRYPVAFVSGKGSILTDTEGKKYIDFFSGWAVSAVGHSHPSIAKALAKQASTLIHVPNNYYNALQSGLAKTIISASFPGKVFFCNSGAEAIEGAIKLARAYGGKKGKTDIITFNKSFHGRTTGAMSATAQAKYQKGMKPLLSGFKKAELNNIQSVKKAFSKKTAAILFEPIQGEGGVREASPEFMKWIRKFCDEHDILMMLDEVQTGIGRTGKLFCYQHYGIKPDVMLLAKSLGGGFPIGAIVAS
ncbi:MAG: aminotransferase class III-fold pyridoxal phosphate-dependent enzyme, partial [Candidatus Omnitrophica bacterium]|nr:aminotransferase class III-fold pyridoxal phosphate-dependent enzyme [Candidatus Omnitrophota bacterium]